MGLRNLLSGHRNKSTLATGSQLNKKAKQYSKNKRRASLESLEDRQLLTCTPGNCADWMADLPGSVRISEISIPGTHDSLTEYDGALAVVGIPYSDHDAVDTQDWKLPKQLEEGIRFLDIRLRKIRERGPGDNLLQTTTRFKGAHGDYLIDIYFPQVLQEVQSFLRSHPTETVLMRVQSEEKGALNCAFNSCKTDVEVFDRDFAANGSEPFLYRASGNTPPTLDDVRGKMVIFADSFNYPGFYQNSDIVVQNSSTSGSGQQVFEWTKDHLDFAHAGTPDKFYRMGMTGQDFFGGDTPYKVATEVNPLAEQHFATDLGLRTTGIITMDYPEITPNLIPNIVNQNTFACPDCPIPDVYRANVGGPAIFGDTNWVSDSDVALYVNAGNTENLTTTLCGLEDTNELVPTSHGSRFGRTQNVSLTWRSNPDAGKWEQYSGWPNDPGCGVYQLEDTNWHSVSFQPDAGWNVAIDSFDLNVHPDGDSVESTLWEVFGAESGLIASGTQQVPDDSPRTVITNVAGVNGERLTLFLTNLVSGDDLAMDNLRFRQVEDPANKHASVPDGTPMEIFRSSRWDSSAGDDMRFAFPVVPGTFEVKLYFAENDKRNPGESLFDVSIDGKLVLDNYDKLVRAGGFGKGIVESFEVTNTDGVLDIEFDHVLYFPTISGIEIIRKSDAPSESHWVNAGGPELVGNPTWSGDTRESPSQLQTGSVDVASRTTTIDMSHASVPSGTPMQLFQTERWDRADAPEMEWDFPVVPGNYEVSLYFAEIAYNTVGTRVFDVSIEGRQVLDNYDIVADVGPNKGVVKSFTVASDGNLDIDFGHVVENPKVAGIRIVPASPVTPAEPKIELSKSSFTTGEEIVIEFNSPNFSPTDWIGVYSAEGTESLEWQYLPESAGSTTFSGLSEPGQYIAYLFCCDSGDTLTQVEFEVVESRFPTQDDPVHSINAGGPAVGNWSGDLVDSVFRNNTSNSFISDQAIDLSHSSVPAGTPESVFQSERWDAPDGEELKWNFPVEPGEYDVNLYFAEIFHTEAGRRVFDVSIEGNQVLNDYDIVAEVGSAFRGVVTTHRVTSDAVLNIEFGHLIENPKVSGIEIIPVSSVGITEDPGADDLILGDINEDGNVDFADFLVLSTNFGNTVAVAGFDGDIDEDGIVAFSDFLILSTNFGRTSVLTFEL